MANVNLFNSVRGPVVKATDTVNEAGGNSYKLDDRQALAQLAGTGCINRTCYVNAETQLSTVIELAKKLPSDFVAKTAVFARKQGYMKDMPALLLAVLVARKEPVVKSIFKRVINNGKMLRNFVQIVRSGVTGRKSFGTAPKRLLRDWFDKRSDSDIFLNSIGNDPSLADIIKMVHPKPNTKGKEALYGWFIGSKDYNADNLPQIVKDFELFCKDGSANLPDVPFEMLTAKPLTKEGWTQIARNAKWVWTCKNLNTMSRHGVFENPEMVDLIAERLSNRGDITNAKVFPYQLLAAYQNAGADVPAKIRNALNEAMEIATQNVPPFAGKTYLCVDVSGSMSSPVTGHRAGSTSKVSCVDVAGLMASIFLRRNKDAEIIPFADSVKNISLNAGDSILTNAKLIAGKLGGGTSCSAPLAMLNNNNAKGDLVIVVSDNQSWADAYGNCRLIGHTGGTRLMTEWTKFRNRNKNAKMVCLDLQPQTTTQAYDRDDIMNIGGFSDSVFRIIHQFAIGELNADHWVGEIEKINLAEENNGEIQKK